MADDDKDKQDQGGFRDLSEDERRDWSARTSRGLPPTPTPQEARQQAARENAGEESLAERWIPGYTAAERGARAVGRAAGAAAQTARDVYRSAITPPPPTLPRTPQATMRAQPGFLGRLGEEATRYFGGFDEQGRPIAPTRDEAPISGMFREEATQTGRAEAPLRTGAGDVIRRAGEYGGMLMQLSPLIPEVGYAVKPRATPVTPRARTETNVPRGTEDLRPLPVPGEAAPTPRPRPSAGAQLDPVAIKMYGQPYNDLTSEQQIQVTRNISGYTGPERRVTPGQAPVAERRASTMPPPGETPEARAAREVGEARGGEYPKTNVFEDFNQENRRRINQAVAEERRGQAGTLPPAPAATTLPAGRPAGPAPSGTLPTVGPVGTPPGGVPRLADLLRGWGGAYAAGEEEALPPVRPSEEPPKK